MVVLSLMGVHVMDASRFPRLFKRGLFLFDRQAGGATSVRRWVASNKPDYVGLQLNRATNNCGDKMYKILVTFVNESIGGRVILSRRPWVLLAMCTVSLVVAATPVVAGPITTVPTSLSSEDRYHLAFVTSTSIDGLSDDISVYNTFVDVLGDLITPLDWRVIGSTPSIDVRTNMSTAPTPAGPKGVPISILNDTMLAANYDDLWDLSILTPFAISNLGDNRGHGQV